MFGFLKKDKPDNSFITTPPVNSRPASDINKPADPDDFFGKQEVPAKAQSGIVDPDDFFAAPKKKKEVREIPAEIDTGTLNTDQVLDKDAEAKAARRMNIEKTQGIDTENLNTDRILDEDRAAAEARRHSLDTKQETPVNSRSASIDPNDFFARPQKQKSEEVPANIDTEVLNTAQILDADAEAKAARRVNVEKTPVIDTESLNTDQILNQQAQISAAKAVVIEDKNGIDTSVLDMDGLRDFEFNYDDDEEEDAFDYSNDVDYGEVAAPVLEKI